MGNKFILMFCMILLVGSVSAFEFDNKLEYSNNDLKVNFKNSIGAFGFGITTSEIGTAELKSHKSVDEIKEVSIGNAVPVMWYEFNFKELYKDGLGDVIFIDMKTGDKVDRNYYFAYFNKGEWIKLDSKNIPNGKITIGLIVEVRMFDYIDGIWTIAGKKVNKHASWGASLNTDLEGYWSMNETVGDSNDVSGNGRTLTESGTVPNVADGILSSARGAFSDANYFANNNTINFGYGDSFTSSFWLNKTSDPGGDERMVVFGCPTTGNFYGVVSVGADGKLDFRITKAGSAYDLTILNKIIPSHEWVNVVVTYDGGTKTGELFINNISQGTDTTAYVTNTSKNLSIGSSFGTLGSTWGYIDELILWSRVLTNGEIGDYYNSGSPPFLNESLDFNPKVSLNSPTLYANLTNPLITFNCTASDNLQLDNVSLYINGVIEDTNTSGINNTDYIFTKTLSEGGYNWTCGAVDNNSQTTIASSRFFNVSLVYENSHTFNATTYETATENFILNISYSSLLWSSINSTLNYNGTTYAGTKSGTGDTILFTTEVDIPNGGVGNNTIYWITSLTNATGTFNYNSSINYQYVNNTLLGLCNASLTVPYINFTFVDEETLANINATIDVSTWSYWLGDGTYKKTLLFSNTTENDYYTFCLLDGNQTMHNTRSIQYSSNDILSYPQRKYDASNDLTNVMTNTILYLLSSVDGIYSTIQVVDEQGDKQSNVEVTAERQFSGVWTVIGQETTDSAGAVTFWVNPDYDHRFTFVSEDCTGTTVTIRPTQTQYTQQLQCGAGTDIYVSQLEGIKYARTPNTGIIQAGTYNFSYQLVSSKSNIINASFYIVNSSDGTVLNSTISSCTPDGCTLYMMHVVSSGNDIKGKYYVDLGNGSMLLEGDARWRCILIPTAGKAGVATFFQDLMYVFSEWGSTDGGGPDTVDFNRIVFIFFFMCIAIATLNYNFNMDSINPGMFLFIMTLVIVMGSLVGGIEPTSTSHGLFYYNNLTTNAYLNNYILAGICIMMTISSWITVNRRSQQ